MVNVDPTDAGHDPEDYSGFTEFHLEILSRFRDVAVDNHLQDGNLDGSTGAWPDVNAHIKGVVDQETLSFTVSAWIADYDQAYGLEEALVIIGNVVNNLEENRNLESQSGAGDPLAEDVRKTGSDMDFALNVQPQTHLKWASADFEVRTRRRKPR